MTLVDPGIRAQSLPEASRSAKTRRRWIGNTDLRIAFVISAISAAVIVAGVDRYPTLTTDEGTYTAQAWSVIHGALTPYTYTYDHPFMGWIQIALPSSVSEYLHLGGQPAVVNVRVVMACYAFATMMLTYGVARRLGIRRSIAALSLVALGLSPLYVEESRQVFLDNIAMPWLLLSFYLALSPSRHLWKYGCAGLAMGFAILTKETTLVFLPALLYMSWRAIPRYMRSMSFMLLILAAGLEVAIYPLFAILRNEFVPSSHHVSLIGNGIAYQLASRAGSGALWQDNTARQSELFGWLSSDRYLFLGGISAAIVCAAVRKYRGLFIAMLVWAIPVLKPSGYLPTMYIIGILPFCALALGAAIEATVSHLASRSIPRWTSVVLASFLCLAVIVPIGAAYYVGDRARLVADPVKADEDALVWTRAHVPTNDRLLIDDAMFVDLQDAGYSGAWRTVAFFKFDLDPIATEENLPDKWKDINYVIVTHQLLARVESVGSGQSNTKDAFQHSTIVARFGTGQDEIDIRRVEATPENS